MWLVEGGASTARLLFSTPHNSSAATACRSLNHSAEGSTLLRAGSAGNKTSEDRPKRSAKRSAKASTAFLDICAITCKGLNLSLEGCQYKAGATCRYATS